MSKRRARKGRPRAARSTTISKRTSCKWFTPTELISLITAVIGLATMLIAVFNGTGPGPV